MGASPGEELPEHPKVSAPATLVVLGTLFESGCRPAVPDPRKPQMAQSLTLNQDSSSAELYTENVLLPRLSFPPSLALSPQLIYS